MTIRKWGAETRVNSTVAGDQTRSDVAVLADGGFVVVWQDSDGDVKFQRFDGAGAKVGGERVFEVGGDPQTEPRVTGTADGGWVITATDPFNNSPDTDIVGRRYDASGAGGQLFTLGGSDAEGHSALAASLTGFVTAYDTRSNAGSDVTVTKSNGVNGSTTFRANADGTGVQYGAQITTLKSGTIVVSWADATQGAVEARLFSPTGVPLTGDLTVSGLLVNGDGYFNSVTALAGGGFVVTWSTDVGGGRDTDYEIQARLYNRYGEPEGGVFGVNSTRGAQQDTPDVVALPDGGFAAVFYDSGPDNGFSGDIRIRAFDSRGFPTGRDAVVNTNTQGLQLDPSVAMLPDGRLVVTWTDAGVGDGAGAAIQMQIVDLRDGMVEGTERSDSLWGSALGDQITGLGGADTLYGLGGDDWLIGGDDADQLFGDAGDDILEGSRGADRLDGGAGADQLYGGDGDDALSGAEGADFLRGMAGNDVIDGGSGANVLWGDEGDDVLLGGVDAETFLGGIGADQVYAGGGADVVRGEDGSDFLRGMDGNDQIRGGEGADVIIGDAGGDLLWGDAGADRFVYLAQSDSTVAASDQLIDFQSGVDKIDFTAVTAGRSVSWALLPAGGGYTALDVDFGSDGVVDMRLVLSPGATVTAGDLLF